MNNLENVFSMLSEPRHDSDDPQSSRIQAAMGDSGSVILLSKYPCFILRLVYGILREVEGCTAEGPPMNIDHGLLMILCCPETKQPVSLADPSLIQKLNEAIARGELKNRGQKSVSEPIDGGLLRVDGKILYPVREDIPVMLIEEGIPLPQRT